MTAAHESPFDARVEEEVATVQHALAMIGGTGWIARSEAEIALGRLAAWADAGIACRDRRPIQTPAPTAVPQPVILEQTAASEP